VDEVQTIVDYAKTFFLKTGYHPPIAFIKGTQGKVALEFKTFGATAGERELDMLNAGTMIACKRNVGELELIVFVNEAWMGRNMDILPSLDPKRVEVLLINSLDTRTQEEYLLTYEVKRDPNGTVTNLVEMALPKTGFPKGRLLPAFQKGYQIISPVKN
jgi:hypothetical protein